jgi:DNA-binding protein H-NS
LALVAGHDVDLVDFDLALQPYGWSLGDQAAAGQQRDARRESGTRELIEEFRARAGRPPGRARAARKGAPAASPAAKYRNPETGETWSGRGRVPRWLRRAEERGRGREEFTIKG